MTDKSDVAFRASLIRRQPAERPTSASSTSNYRQRDLATEHARRLRRVDGRGHALHMLEAQMAPAAVEESQPLSQSLPRQLSYRPKRSVFTHHQIESEAEIAMDQVWNSKRDEAEAQIKNNEDLRLALSEWQNAKNRLEEESTRKIESKRRPMALTTGWSMPFQHTTRDVFVPPHVTHPRPHTQQSVRSRSRLRMAGGEEKDDSDSASDAPPMQGASGRLSTSSSALSASMTASQRRPRRLQTPVAIPRRRPSTRLSTSAITSPTASPTHSPPHSPGGTLQQIVADRAPGRTATSPTRLLHAHRANSSLNQRFVFEYDAWENTHAHRSASGGGTDTASGTGSDRPVTEAWGGAAEEGDRHRASSAQGAAQYPRTAYLTESSGLVDLASQLRRGSSGRERGIPARPHSSLAHVTQSKDEMPYAPVIKRRLPGGNRARPASATMRPQTTKKGGRSPGRRPGTSASGGRSRTPAGKRGSKAPAKPKPPVIPQPEPEPEPLPPSAERQSQIDEIERIEARFAAMKMAIPRERLMRALVLTDDKPPSRLQTFMAPTIALTSDPMAEAKRELAKKYATKKKRRGASRKKTIRRKKK